jgi:hypothetical protein
MFGMLLFLPVAVPVFALSDPLLALYNLFTFKTVHQSYFQLYPPCGQVAAFVHGWIRL